VVAGAADIQEQVVQRNLLQAAFINPGTEPLGGVVPWAKTWHVLREPASLDPTIYTAAETRPLGESYQQITATRSDVRTHTRTATLTFTRIRTTSRQPGMLVHVA
jgi:hypothetical protein